MYAKLIFQNAKRSAKDYLIYLVTMTICVALFYSFLSISSRYYQPDIGSAYDVTLLGGGMKFAICLITLCLLFLIRFVNQYMLRRRQKEFAVQAVMGMEQTTLARLFFAETFIMCGISIVCGIAFGVVCSQFITAMLLTSYGAHYRLSCTLFPDTVLWTAGFFVFSFLAVGVGNVRTIRKTKIIDMLAADRKNEPALPKSRWIAVVIILFEICTFWALLSGIGKARFYYDPRLPLPVKLLIYGNLGFPALTLLCSALWLIGRRKTGAHTLLPALFGFSLLNAFAAANVPALTRKYWIPWGSGTIRQYLVFVLADLLFSICALICLAGNFIAAWKERSPEHRYRNENLFFFGQIISRLNTTAQTMTLICMTFTLAIVLFMTAPVLVNWASGYLDARSMYDVQIFSRYNNVYEEKDLPHTDYPAVTEFLAAHEIETAYDCAFPLYLPERSSFHNRFKYDFPVVAIALRDYNRIREMLGFEPISLSDGEFTTQWQSTATAEERDAFLAGRHALATDAGTLTLAESASYTEPIGQTVYNSYTDVLYILPDNVCEKLLPVMQNRYIKTAETLSYSKALELERCFAAAYPEQSETGVSFSIRLRTLQVNSTKAGNFVLQASMLYAAIVLMVICLTILSLQQLLDAGQYQYRFSVLRKLGVEEARIHKLIWKQLGVWFGLPIVVATAAAAVIVGYFMQTVSVEISAYIGPDALMLQIGATAGILTILLVCYFISTWVLFKNSIAE